MSTFKDLQFEILRLKNENSECKAAIKDVAYSAADTPWKKWWLIRYSDLLPNGLRVTCPPSQKEG